MLLYFDDYDTPCSTSACANCFTRLFDKIKNAVCGKNKYQTKRKDLNSRLILGDDY